MTALANFPKNALTAKSNAFAKKTNAVFAAAKDLPGSDMKACEANKGQVSWVGDKTCDDFNNICVCGWDKGGCCMDKDKNPLLSHTAKNAYAEIPKLRRKSRRAIVTYAKANV